MITYLRENLSFYILLLVWLLIGVWGGPVVYLLLPLTILLLTQKGKYEELFIGFWFILILSDSLSPQLGFAKSAKNLYIVLVFLVFLLRRREFIPLNRYYQRFLPFFLIAFTCIIYTETLSIAIQKTISYILLFIVVPNFVEKIYRDKGEYFFKRFCYFFLLILLLGIGMKYVFPDIALSHGGRFRGIFGNPNGLGIFSVLTFILFTIVTEYFPDLFSRNERRMFFIVLIITIIFTGSRNSVLAILIFLFFSRFYKMSPFLGFILLFVIGGIAEVVSNNYATIIKALGLGEFFRLKTLDQGAGRIIAWGFAWEQIQRNLFIGKGFGFDEYIMRKNYALLSREGHEGGVHNSYLILWLNTGLVGLLAYLWAFISTFIQAAKNSRFAFPIMYTVMFTIMFEPWIAASLNPFTIIYLIIITIILSPTMNLEGKSAEISEGENSIEPV